MGMPFIKSVAAGGLALMVSMAAQAAAIYEYSYTFGGNRSGLQNVLIHGTVQGESDGSKVSGITNITLDWTHNGVTTAFTGPLSIIGYYSTLTGDTLRNEQQMWFDRDSNNFLVSNAIGCDVATDTCSGPQPADLQEFLLRNGAGGGDEDADLVDGNVLYSADSFATDTWSLRFLRDVDPGNPAPEPGSLALALAAFAALGAAGRRRATRS